MRVLVVGGGIGGLATALSLHAVGIDCTVFEQVRELRELGVGINTLPHAIKEQAALGLLPALDKCRHSHARAERQPLRWCGVSCAAPTRGSIHHSSLIHRGRLPACSWRRARSPGRGCVARHCRLVSFSDHSDHVVARFEQRELSGAFAMRATCW
jgi:2-polyprenyl-6-methoxyphenol hydroxylase-like FAD-dependent oxidoreductase